MTHDNLTEQQKQEALDTGRCPECAEPMKHYRTDKSNKPELHCHSCKLSVPMFKTK